MEQLSLNTLPPPLPDLDGAPAQEVLSWAIDAFFPDVAVACSMQDGVVVDLAVRIEPSIEVFFLNTGFHLPQTLETARQLRRRYRLNLVELRPEPAAAVYARDGYEACCAARKVAPMERYLEGKRAWVTGIRRAESPSRAKARTVEWDARRKLVKVNPIVAWSDEDVNRYIADHHVIVNPLRFLVDLLGDVRQEMVRDRPVDFGTWADRWQRALERDLLGLVREGRGEEAKELLRCSLTADPIPRSTQADNSAPAPRPARRQSRRGDHRSVAPLLS